MRREATDFNFKDAPVEQVLKPKDKIKIDIPIKTRESTEYIGSPLEIVIKQAIEAETK